KRLRAELPSLNIPVVYGSAWLGNLRLQAEAGEMPAPSQSAPQPMPVPTDLPETSVPQILAGTPHAHPQALELEPINAPRPALSRTVQSVPGAPACPAAAAREELARATPAVHMSSGMADVSAAITRLMCTSSVAMLMRQLAVCLAELVRGADVTDRAELQSIEALIATRREEAAVLTRRVEEAGTAPAASEQPAVARQASFAALEAHC